MIIYYNIFAIVTSHAICGLRMLRLARYQVCDLSFGIMSPRLYLFLWRTYSAYTILYKQQNEFQNFNWFFSFISSHSALILQVSLG